MSKLGIASDAGLGMGFAWSSLKGNSTGHHRNGLVKKRSYGALERCSDTLLVALAPFDEVAATSTKENVRTIFADQHVGAVDRHVQDGIHPERWVSPPMGTTPAASSLPAPSPPTSS